MVGVATPVNMVWTPPPGATNFSFSQPPEPGGPPFQWKNVDPLGGFTQVSVDFDLPPLPPSRTNMMVGDTLQASPVDHPEVVSAATAYTLIDKNLAAADTSLSLGYLPSDTAAPPPATAPVTGTIPVWHALLYYTPGGPTLTTAVCQDAIDLLRAGDAFFALRVPKPTAPVTASVPLPFVYDPPLFPSLNLRDFTASQVIFTGTLAYRPERQTFANNSLPSAPNEHWVTMALAADAMACPAGLNIPAPRWGIALSLALDLSGQPGQCAGCVLPYYLCYAGQDDPLANPALTLVGNLPQGSAVTSYQGEGITCVGPNLLQMSDWDSAWEVNGPPAIYISPTVTTTITLPYQISNLLSDSPLQVASLAVTATVDADWQWYAGSWIGPNPNEPLTFPLTVPEGDTAYVWLVGSLPSGTADGPYTVKVTATAAAAPPTWAVASQIWVGDWVAPPPQPPPAAPQQLLPSDGATVGRAVALSWRAGVGEVPLGFEIEVDGVITPTHNTRQTFILAQGAHNWRLRADNDSGYSPWSPLRTFTVADLPPVYLPLVTRN
jgi:hypothetical protein